MSSIQWLGLLVTLLSLVLNGHICNAGKVSEKVCSDGGTECNTILNSACDVPNLKCKCNTGFKEGGSDGSTCIKLKVSETVCSNGGSECNTITNTACDVPNLKCKCNTGFKEDGSDGSTCIKQRVSEVVCSNGGSECTVITHSVCDATLKCKCGTGYGEDTNDGSTCVQEVDSTVCTQGTECNSIDHAECDSTTHKCKCSDGFKMNADNCIAAEKNAERVSKVVCTNGGSECITHSACDVTLKCKCDTGYGEDTNDGSTCVKEVDSTVCTQGTVCNSIDHAECDSTTHKCKCSDGFKMNADKCIAAEKNAGMSATLAFVVLALPVILSIKEVIM